MDWNDTYDIAIALDEHHPDIDPLTVPVTDLRDWGCALEGFGGDPERCGEKILEAIQMAWLEERQ